MGQGTTLKVTNTKRNSVYGVQVNQLAVEGSLTVTTPAFNNSTAICFSDSACDIYVTKTGAIKAESSVNSSTATIAGQSAIAINAGSNGSVYNLGKLTVTTSGGKNSNGIRAKTVILVDGSMTEVNSAAAAMSSGTIKYGDHITFIAGSSSKSAYATAANSVFNQKYFKAGNNIGGSVMPTTLKSLSKAKKAMTVKWNKKSSYFVKGYQIQYSTSSKFKKAKKVTVKGAGSSSKKITKLKKKKKYYVRIRTYSTVSGKTKYSSWSKSKTVKTK